MLEIDLREISNITCAISNYHDLASCFMQLDPSQREDLEKYHNMMLKYSRDGKYADHRYFEYWKSINLYVVKQMWGSTSGGWGGIGGAAMTESYTVIIENHWTGAVFVYYGGSLAYVALDNEELKKYKSDGFRSIPALYSTKDLEIVYKNKNQKRS